MKKDLWYSIGEWDQPLLFTAIEAGFAESNYGQLLTPKLDGGYKVESRKFYFSQKALRQFTIYTKDPAFLDRYIRIHKKFLAEYQELMKKYSFPKVQSRKEVLEIFNIFVEATRNTAYFMDTGLLLDKALMGILLKKVDFNTLSYLVQPEVELDITKEIQGLRDIHELLEKNIGIQYKALSAQKVIELLKFKYSRVYNKIQKHTEEYSYLPMQTFRGHPWKTEDFIERAKILLPVAHTKQVLPKLPKIDKDTRSLIKKLKILNEFRTVRIEYVNKWIWLLEPLWKAVAKYLKIDIEEVKSLSVGEIQKCLELEKPYLGSKKELKLRNSAYTCLYQKGIFTYHSAAPVKAPNVENHIQVLKGMTGNGGKVIGRVRIIRGVDEFKNFKAGEILVTSQTTPNFVTIMSKAKAIITDQGGITSHAAIVSRELGVPCVIGTKVATQVLKEGDMVEVDAYKGIVRRIID